MRTSLYSILCIAIRIGAVILAAEVLVALPGTLDSVIRNGEFQLGLKQWLLVFYGLFFVFAAALWIYPGLLARLAAGESSRQVFESPLAADDWQYIAISVVGVFLAISGFSEILGVGARIIVASHVEGIAASGLRETDIARLVALIVKIALGMGLAFGARGLVGLFHTLRERGLPPVAAISEEPTDDSGRPTV